MPKYSNLHALILDGPMHCPHPSGAPAKITDHGKKMTSCDRKANLYFSPPISRQLHATCGRNWKWSTLTECGCRRYLRGKIAQKRRRPALRSTLRVARWHLCFGLSCMFSPSIFFSLLSARSAQEEAWLELAINRENGTKKGGLVSHFRHTELPPVIPV